MFKKKKPATADRAPMMESLEGRQLLSHSVFATKLATPSSNSAGVAGDPINTVLTVKLTANGLPLRTATITFAVDGSTTVLANGQQTTMQGVTGRSGYASFVIPALFPGNHTISASFAGATRYTGSKSRSAAVAVVAPHYTTTSDGLKYATVVAGTGAAATSTSTVQVNYIGYLTNGTMFDTSINREPDTSGNDTTDFTVDNGYTLTDTIGQSGFIQGFDEGVVGMKVGETRVLVIPGDIAYGDRPPTGIPDNATLVFYVKMEAIS